MTALRTGWTPDVLAEMPVAFRAACHWALYAETIAGPEGLPSTERPAGLPSEHAAAWLRTRAEVLRLRDVLYPGDEVTDGDA